MTATTVTSQQRPAAQASGPVLIVGGGFAGLYTALALAEQRQPPPVLLLEPNDRFLFLPLLYELLSGELRGWEIAPRYDALLASKGIAWMRDRVSHIDSTARQVTTRGGRRLDFGQLVLATGGDTSSFGIPGVEAHALSFRSLDDVERLQQLVQQLRAQQRPLQRLAIVGAGPSGVELACKLSDLLGGTALVELIEQAGEPLQQAKAFNREQAVRALQLRDVRLRTHTRVREVGASRLELEGPTGAETLAVQATIWTAGLAFQPPTIEPAPTSDRRGRLLCDDTLRLQGYTDLFAAGDIACVKSGENDLPANAQVAFQQATCLAANLVRARAGEPLEPFGFRDLGEMMSLGVGDASLVGGGVTLAGPAAFQLRRLAYLTRLPGRSHQLRVAAGWLADWRPAAAGMHGS
ncbi:NAD(P)/FAD-dependent oxidoreductase [Cyanobium sp. NS01]|uniref:NAD(P)/FAD-dependent oxidoreductase n=1 Tax=Cyanobium sp. NS01 TaxID=261284 RepID=UPI001648F122|nr:FAD-dependent oxidoreductase [Cyanobium sp. NS01]QNI69632.1 type 2 NADH dehydrogenase [Cyanobium sp. NS01]